MKVCILVLILTAGLTVDALPAQARQVVSQSSPLSPQPIAQVSPVGDVAAVAQQFVDFLADGNYASARELYGTNVDVTPASIQQNWADILTNVGAYQSQLGTRVVSLENPSGGTMAIVGVQFENATRALFITFNSDRQIVSLDIVDETN